MTHYRLRLALALLWCVAGCSSPQPSRMLDRAASLHIDSLPADRSAVLASATEVRIIFPRDTAHRWGWSGTPVSDFEAQYGWSLRVNGTERPQRVELRVAREDNRAREFGSLAELVATGRPGTCSGGGMIATCNRDSTTALVHDSRVMLVVRDSAAIASMFGLRPEWVETFTWAPGSSRSERRDSVRVTYVAPRIPAPTDSLRAHSARAWDDYQRSLNWVRRFMRRMDAPQSDQGALWVETGDTALVSTLEVRCRSDVCGGGYETDADTGWLIGDSTIALLRRPRDLGMGDRLGARNSVVAMLGVRPGRTTIRVVGLRSPADDIPMRSPPPATLERPVLVTRPIRTFQLVAPREPVFVGDSVGIDLRIVDDQGTRIPEAPVEILMRGPRFAYLRSGTGPQVFVPDEPAMWIIQASLGGLRDSVSITVLPRRRR